MKLHTGHTCWGKLGGHGSQDRKKTAGDDPGVPWRWSWQSKCRPNRNTQRVDHGELGP